ncbi:MAG: ATP-dependent DNA helicase [Candidatus Atabeyarchaeum deiterrae]
MMQGKVSLVPILPTPLSYFPYSSVRLYQDEFINMVHEAVKLGQHVAVAAASGLGKTIGVLSATLPFVSENGFRILYVARTHKECDRAIEELKVVSKKCSGGVSGISIRGRSEACFNKLILDYSLDATTAMEICGELKKRGSCQFFEKLRSNRKDLQDVIRRISGQPTLFNEIAEISKVHGFCAYELAKLIVGKVDVAAMSYNYLLHDEIRQSLLKSFERPLSSYILVMDEAHNLPDIAANMASERMSTAALRGAGQEARRFGLSHARRFIESVCTVVENIRDNAPEREVALPGVVLLEKLAREHGVGLDELETLFVSLHESGESIKKSLLEKGKLPRSSVHHLAGFLMRWLETSTKQHYVHVLTSTKSDDDAGGSRRANLEIVCLDPSQITSHVIAEVHSSISMSGTLEPIECYVDVAGLPADTKSQVFGCPFPRENINIVFCRGVSTALSDRSLSMYEKLSLRISEAVNSTPINTGVFVASYDVLNGLVNAGLESLLEKPVFKEQPESTSNKNDVLIESFCKSASSGGGVLLGVQGGRNSEGLDLPGDLLNTVVVVGVPYAKPTPRVKASIDYYESKFPNRGKEYGYNIPAFRKAAQAAGRAFRSVDDRGVVLFLDHRFAKPPCIKLLPSWIRESYKILSDVDGAISKELNDFYSSGSSSKS